MQGTDLFKDKNILILGANGQMGAHMSEYFVQQGCKSVHGTVRRHSVAETQSSRILDDVASKMKLHYMEILDSHNVNRVINESKPDYIFHTVCQSHVGISFFMPDYALSVAANGTLNVLEGMRIFAPNAKMIHFSTSETFGNSITKVPSGILNEDSPKEPVSPYACGKLAAYSLVKNYRHAYGMHVSNIIAFNFESKYRGENFLPAKVVKGALEIKKGLKSELRLGNLEAKRDWNDARDTMDACFRIVTANEPNDYVVASGETRSVREFCDIVFTKLGMDYRDYVVIDPKYFRPEELHVLKGDSSKIRNELGWEPKVGFNDMVDDMIEYWTEELNK